MNTAYVRNASGRSGSACAAFSRGSQVRGIYRRRYQPSVEQAERLILDHWYSLCVEVATAGADTWFARATIATLHDLGVFRYRAQRRERPACACVCGEEVA